MNDTTTVAVNIGNTTGGTTSIKSNTINIASDAPIDNLKQITIGGTATTFDSNTAMNGKTTISKLATALTPIYSPSTILVSQIGYTISTALTGSYNATQITAGTLTALTSGRWLVDIVLNFKGTTSADSGSLTPAIFSGATNISGSLTPYQMGTSYSQMFNMMNYVDISFGSTSDVTFKLTGSALTTGTIQANSTMRATRIA